MEVSFKKQNLGDFVRHLLLSFLDRTDVFLFYFIYLFIYLFIFCHRKKKLKYKYEQSKKRRWKEKLLNYIGGEEA